MREEWRDIKGYEGLYQVSNFGRARGLDRPKWIQQNNSYGVTKGKVLKTPKNSNGYSWVTITKEGVGKNIPIHQLVWDAFGDKQRDKSALHIDHVDGDKSNNRIDNLQLLSPRMNHNKFLVQSGKTTKYIGTYLHKRDKAWHSRIRLGNKRIFLGCFKTEIQAALAYQKALISLGEIQ